MTKAKKKMTKSTFVIIIMAVAMVAMLAFGGTFAYFTASTTDKSGTITTGKVQLNASGDFVAELNNIMPGDEITNGKITLSTAESTEATYVAIRYTITANDSTGTPIDDLSTINLESVLDLKWVESDTDGIYVYSDTSTDATPVNAGTTIDVTTAALVFDADDNWVQGEGSSTAKLMGATITIKFEARSIQSSGFENAAAAVAELVTKF